jgi:hypothetical protein
MATILNHGLAMAVLDIRDFDFLETGDMGIG